MADGQQVLGGDALPELTRAVAGLEQLEREKRALHAKTLAAVLDVHAAHGAADLALVTTAQLALSLDCSEHRAQLLLREAQLMALLPDALDALASGLLGVEQSALFVRMTDPLEDDVRAQVWDRLLDSLTATGGPARLAEALSRWIVKADPAGAEMRRRTAERDHADVGSRRREDGLTDLFACGLSPTSARACLDRISSASAPWGGQDDRPAGKRRLDALVDLLLGRQHLDPAEEDPDVGGGHCPPGCACLLQQPAPCGVNVHVHVPLGAALGNTAELATLVGHGPLDPGQLRDILMNSPLLRAVYVDSDGVPVSLGEGTLQPAPRDLTSVQRALLTLATRPPGHPAWQCPVTPTTTPGRPVQPEARDPDPAAAYCPAKVMTRLAPLRGPTPAEPPVRTAYPLPCAGSPGPAGRCASGQAAGTARPGATSTTTAPGRTAPRAAATWARCADATTGSSSAAGPRLAGRTVSPGPARRASTMTARHRSNLLRIRSASYRTAPRRDGRRATSWTPPPTPTPTPPTPPTRTASSCGSARTTTTASPAAPHPPDSPARRSGPVSVNGPCRREIDDRHHRAAIAEKALLEAAIVVTGTCA